MLVMLLAEGAGELVGQAASKPRNHGDTIPEEALGAAHLLVRRMIARMRRIEPAEIRFVEPFRNPYTLNAIRGSDLHAGSIGRRLFGASATAQRSDLLAILVDRDAKGDRGSALRSAQADSKVNNWPRSAIGVCVEEFEAWLIADWKGLSDVVRRVSAHSGDPPDVAAPEALAPGEAKRLLAEAVGGLGSDDRRRVRTGVAETADLQTLRDRCPTGFDAFWKDLKAALA